MVIEQNTPKLLYSLTETWLVFDSLRAATHKGLETFFVRSCHKCISAGSENLAKCILFQAACFFKPASIDTFLAFFHASKSDKTYSQRRLHEQCDSICKLSLCLGCSCRSVICCIHKRLYYASLMECYTIFQCLMILITDLDTGFIVKGLVSQ